MNAYAKPVGIEWGFNKNDKETFTVDIEFTNNGEGTGERARVYLSMVGGAREITEDTLDRLGWNGDLENPQFRDEPVEVYEEEFNGRTNWKFSGGGGLKEAPADVRRQRAAAFRGRFGKNAGKSAPPASSPPKKGPPPPSSSAPDEVDYSGVTDRESAWAKLTEMVPDEEKAGQLWIKEIESIGKPEEDFTEKDWQKVASAGIPF